MTPETETTSISESGFPDPPIVPSPPRGANGTPPPRGANGTPSPQRGANGTPSPHRGANETPPQRGANETPTDVDRALQALVDKNTAERKRLRQALLAALIFHAILLAVTFPQLLATPDAPAPAAKAVFVVQQMRFQPPAPRREEVPKRKTRKIPIPDPTPDDPEPIELDELLVVEIDLPDTDPTVFGIPDAPPEAEAFGHGDVMQVGGGVSAPEKIHSPQPRYTEEARQGRIQGTVILQAVIEANGNVSQIKVLKGLPLGLDDSAIKTVESWRFKPATLGGKPVAVYLNLLINFSLQ